MSRKFHVHQGSFSYRSFCRTLLVCASFCLVSLAYGNGVVVRVQESPDGVTMVASGVLDVSSLNQVTSVFTYAPDAVPEDARFQLGVADSDVSTDDGDIYIAEVSETIFSPANFGDGDFTGATSGAGAVFGISEGFSPLQVMILVPDEYVSGAPISSSASFNGSSFASMGLTPGKYVWDWGARSFSESVTMLVGQEAIDEYDAAAIQAALAEAAERARAASRKRLSRKIKKLKRKAKKAKRKGQKKKARKFRRKIRKLLERLRLLQ